MNIISDMYCLVLTTDTNL